MRIALASLAGILTLALSPLRAASQIEVTTLGDGALLGFDHEAQLSAVADLGTFRDGADAAAEAGTDGVVFVADRLGVYRVDRDGGVSPFLDLFDESIVMLSDGKGGLYVARSERDTVLHVGADGSRRVILDGAGDGRGATLDFPSALVLDAAGFLYVSGALSRNVFLVAPTGEILVVLDGTGDRAGHPLDSPQWLGVDAADNLYVADWGGGDPAGCAVPGASNLFRITPWGAVETVAQELLDLDSEGGEPVCWLGLGVAPAGHVDLAGWRGTPGRGRILRVAPDGSPRSLLETCSNGRSARFLLGLGREIDRIQYDDSGSLYVTTLTTWGWRDVFKIDPTLTPGARGQRLYHDRGDAGTPAVTADGEVFLAAGRSAEGVKLLRLRATDPLPPPLPGEPRHYLEGAPSQRIRDGSVLMVRGNRVSDEAVACDQRFWISQAGIEPVEAELSRSRYREPGGAWVAALPEQRKAVFNEQRYLPGEESARPLWDARAMLLEGGEVRYLEALSPEHTSRAVDVSLDGSTIVGGVNLVAQGSWWDLPEEWSVISPDDFDNGYVWRAGEVTPLRALPGIPDHYWKVVGERVSGDGSVIVGRVYSYGLPDEWGEDTGEPNSDWSYFRWESGSFTLLEPPSGWWLREIHELGGASREDEAYRVEALSDDGSVAVGWAQGTMLPYAAASYELPSRVAVRWRADGSIERLPPLPSEDDWWLVSYCGATEVSGDGSLVAGGCSGGGGPWFLWDAENGTRNLMDWVRSESAGSLPALESITRMSALSADGRVLVATCRWADGSWELCKLTLPPACSDGRDNDGDGLVDHPDDRACRSADGESEVARSDVVLDVDPWQAPNVFGARRGSFVTMAILGSQSVDVHDIEAASVTLADGETEPAFPLTHRLLRWISARDWNGDGYPDLMVIFRRSDLGLVPGPNEVCVQGEIAGELFNACDEVELRGSRRGFLERRALLRRGEGRIQRRRVVGSGGWR